MRRMSPVFCAGFLIFAICPFSFSTGHAENRKCETDKVKILSTVFPLMEFAQAIAGDKGEAGLLLPAGAEIHAWQPRPSDLLKVSEADLFVCIGANLEPWVEGILKSVDRPNLRIFRASEGLKLLGEKHHGKERESAHTRKHGQEAVDPHIWLDFSLDQIIVDKLVRMLSIMRPQAAAFFEANGKAYKRRLRLLDQKYFETLSRCENRTFILGGHAAFGYQAKRYGLNQISLYGLNPDAKPSPHQLVKVIESARKYDIRVIYFEINVSDDLAKVIADEIGARTLVLNPAANVTRDQLLSGTTFFDIMEMNLKNLKEGLSCE